MDVSNYEFVLRLIISVICGTVVGLERERKNQAAGLRTHIAVILGATLVMLISKYGFTDIDISSKDPARLAAQVISGIGFLGAGMIIVNRNKVRGLTTAASLWTTACIGLAVGAGFYVPAIATTILLVGTLYLLKIFEHRHVKKRYNKVSVETDDYDNFIDELEHVLNRNNIILIKVDKKKRVSKPDGTGEIMVMDVFLEFPVFADTSFLIGDLSKIPGVVKVELE